MRKAPSKAASLIAAPEGEVTLQYTAALYLLEQMALNAAKLAYWHLQQADKQRRLKK
jgi:hypothetical protein